MSTDAQEVEKEVKIYLTVFAALLFLTIVTVAVSYLQVSLAVAVTIALFVATIKASLVAGFFMHLIHEKQLIYSLLILTAIFFLGLMTLPVFDEKEPMVGQKPFPEHVVSGEAHGEKSHGEHGGGHH